MGILPQRLAAAFTSFGRRSQLAASAFEALRPRGARVETRVNRRRRVFGHQTGMVLSIIASVAVAGEGTSASESDGCADEPHDGGLLPPIERLGALPEG